MKITLDTNCIINLLDGSSKTATSSDELAGLVRLAFSGRFELAITTRVEADLLKDKNADRQAEMLRQLQLFPVVGTVARWDVSRWDTGDVWADGSHARLAEDLTKLIFPGLKPDDKRYSNKVNDIDHLVGHFINGRDIFVTDDRAILRKAEELKASPGIVVMSPRECLSYVEHLAELGRKRALEPSGADAKYHSRPHRGCTTFDYSNNNHRFSIGEGFYLFETMWSKAGKTAIHAYTDAPSIAGVALAKGVAAIKEVRDAAALDYSSRVRSPRLGQIVIWRNVNGLYAATKIIDIMDDTRGDPADELTFDYIILHGGGGDFSKSS